MLEVLTFLVGLSLGLTGTLYLRPCCQTTPPPKEKRTRGKAQFIESVTDTEKFNNAQSINDLIV